MKLWARNIWNAWRDGEPLEYKHSHGVWKEAEPTDFSVESPNDAPHRWRIKKATRTIYYRVYLNRTCNKPHVFTEDVFTEGRLGISAQDFEKNSFFREWLTPWLSYEVEEGE